MAEYEICIGYGNPFGVALKTSEQVGKTGILSVSVFLFISLNIFALPSAFFILSGSWFLKDKQQNKKTIYNKNKYILRLLKY